MITKLDIMLDPDTYDGQYTGKAEKCVISDNSVQYTLDFEFGGKREKIVAEISLVRGLTRTMAMLRENGVKKIAELKNFKFVSFEISNGWVNITGFPDGEDKEQGALSGNFIK